MRMLTSWARCGLGLLFLTSSVAKLYQPYEFLNNVYEYDLFGPEIGLYVAFIVPWLELVLGVTLVLGVAQAGAMILSSVLMATFVVAQSLTMWRGLDISCGCFGSGGEPISYKSLAISGSALLVTMLLLVHRLVCESAHPAAAAVETQSL